MRATQSYSLENEPHASETEGTILHKPGQMSDGTVHRLKFEFLLDDPASEKDF